MKDMYEGIGASEGIGIGKVITIKEEKISIEQKESLGEEKEKKRLDNAIEVFLSHTGEMAERIRKQAGEKEAEILEGHMMMIGDPSMQEEMANRLAEGKCAEQALAEVCDIFIMMFSAADDELTRQRATDVQDLKNRMLKILLGMEEQDLANLPAGTILVAHDLTPSMTAGIDKKNVAGFVTETGGITSHSAILARALEIPAVLSVIGATELLRDGSEVVVDGTRGIVMEAPEATELKEYVKQREEHLKNKEALKKYTGQKTVTADGKCLELVCNIGKPEDAKKVIEKDGEGVGLFRTEFLFMGRSTVPTEEEQFEAYKSVAERMKGKPVIIRTLDVGGDKEISYLNIPKEENPFLGFRAIRYCLANKKLYHTQLRALLRASYYGNIKIMVPLVTCVEEIREVRRMCGEIQQELKDAEIPFREDIQIGIMIETPAACQIADLLAKEADFFSIGTNDLTSYTMSVDRGNAKVGYLNSFYQPAVLRSIQSVIQAGNKAGIPVGMCGEAAADEKMIPLLIAFGLQEFSVNPVSVLKTRAQIHKWTLSAAKELEEEVMQAATEKEVLSLLKK